MNRHVKPEITGKMNTGRRSKLRTMPPPGNSRLRSNAAAKPSTSSVGIAIMIKPHWSRSEFQTQDP